jgi:hypothetical protein
MKANCYEVISVLLVQVDIPGSLVKCGLKLIELRDEREVLVLLIQKFMPTHFYCCFVVHYTLFRA